MLKALIFDVDGTLAETEEAHRQAFNQTFADMGIRVLTTPSWYTANDDFSDAKWVFDSLADAGVQDVLFHKVI